MKNCWFFCVVLLSPSSRAEWVEIIIQDFYLFVAASPSSRAEWVEIPIAAAVPMVATNVSVLAGGVG